MLNLELNILSGRSSAVKTDSSVSARSGKHHLSHHELSLVEKARNMRKYLKVIIRKLDISGINSDPAKCDRRKLSINGVQVGDILGKRYKVEKLLDSGAMANVHLVTDLNNGSTHAMKTLIGAVHKEEVVRRFVRESTALANLNHPKIVNISDLAWDMERDIPYLIMENLAGKKDSKPLNFNTLINQFHNQGIDMNTMLHYFADIGDGLDYLHTRLQPIIHRDLKPSNILVSNDFACDGGTKRQLIKLADFGLARITQGSFTTLTDFGQLMGTPEYSAIPDLLSESYQIDARSDLYSLGVMLYLLISGKLPFSVKASSNAETPIAKNTPIQRNTPNYDTEDEVNPLTVLIQKHLKEEPDFLIDSMRYLLGFSSFAINVTLLVLANCLSHVSIRELRLNPRSFAIFSAFAFISG
jgi:serine/threonine protein kinase